MEDITTARNVLISSLQKTRELSVQIDKTGVSLRETRQRLVTLESTLKSVAHKCSLLPIREQIDHAVGPAVAVLKVSEVVNSLETTLSRDPCSSDLLPYLSSVKQLEEALRFLANNSGLVIFWLEDVLRFFVDNKVEDDWYLSGVRKCVSILRELQTKEQTSCHDGGPFSIIMKKIENEFQHILMENAFPMKKATLPEPIIQKLQAIITRMKANNRVEKCVSIYVQVRSSTIKSTIEALDLNYLNLSLSEFDRVQSIESYVDQWSAHLEFIVKKVLEFEYNLCNEVFDKAGTKTWTACFSEIAAKSGMQGFIKFGNTVTKGKKDAMKLLKLLDIFGTLYKLRLDFNRVFGGKACAEIQAQTRDLVKNVVDGACGIFWELSVQVEMQRNSSPPPDGSVPRLVSFVIEFLNELLEEDCKSILIQVLEIQMSWKNESFDEGFVTEEILKIMRVVEVNLEIWGNTYEDTALSCVFMMNSHCYLSRKLKGTKLGDMMGDSWLTTHEQATEHYVSIYMRESWAELPSILTDNGNLKDFINGFDRIYNKQSKWVVYDKKLRSKISELVAEIIVPVYRSYVHNYYTHVIDRDISLNKSMKYSVEAVEDMIGCLFQPQLRNLSRSNTVKCTQSVGNMGKAVNDHFSSTHAAARVF